MYCRYDAPKSKCFSKGIDSVLLWRVVFYEKDPGYCNFDFGGFAEPEAGIRRIKENLKVEFGDLSYISTSDSFSGLYTTGISSRTPRFIGICPLFVNRFAWRLIDHFFG